jgi:hypothetical protein
MIIYISIKFIDLMEVTFIRHTEKEETGEDPFLTKKGD